MLESAVLPCPQDNTGWSARTTPPEELRNYDLTNWVLCRL